MIKFYYAPYIDWIIFIHKVESLYCTSNSQNQKSIKEISLSPECVIFHRKYFEKSAVKYMSTYNHKTVLLRDTVHQTFQGKWVAARLTAAEKCLVDRITCLLSLIFIPCCQIYRIEPIIIRGFDVA